MYCIKRISKNEIIKDQDIPPSPSPLLLILHSSSLSPNDTSQALDDEGSGTLSDILEALSWVYNQHRSSQDKRTIVK